MLLSLAHKIAEDPSVYDLLQKIAGRETVAPLLARQCQAIVESGVVLDLAGGTGVSQRYVPNARYICLDIEAPKLNGFRLRQPEGLAILGDCTRVPLRDSSVDGILCFAMSHHLDDAQWDAFLDEAHRSLRPEGAMIFFDAVRTRRWAGRLLWRMDRGSNPRPAERLIEDIGRRFRVDDLHRFHVHHEYVVATCRPLGK